MLQESYLGKVKMIYIDPPYNTGSDFVYQDDFAKSSEEYAEESGQLDENGNHLFNVSSITAFRRLLPRTSFGERKFPLL